MNARLHIGIDLDNTIISYDESLEFLARRDRRIAPDALKGKKSIRDALLRLKDGEMAWRRLQAEIYGPGIGLAKPFPGVRRFLSLLRAGNIPVCVVSHKTRRSNLPGYPTDLRRCATDWLAANGFFDAADPCLDPDAIFFEDERSAKLRRIAALGVTHFIDDLAEVFAEPAFPAGTEKWLFSPGAAGDIPEGVKAFGSWAEIEAAVRDLIGAGGTAWTRA